MKEEPIEWVDIAKGIGIISVPMGHIFQYQILFQENIRINRFKNNYNFKI